MVEIPWVFFCSSKFEATDKYEKNTHRLNVCRCQDGQWLATTAVVVEETVVTTAVVIATAIVVVTTATTLRE